jgi:hypothetical protein
MDRLPPAAIMGKVRAFLEDFQYAGGLVMEGIRSTRPRHLRHSF